MFFDLKFNRILRPARMQNQPARISIKKLVSSKGSPILLSMPNKKKGRKSTIPSIFSNRLNEKVPASAKCCECLKLMKSSSQGWNKRKADRSSVKKAPKALNLCQRGFEVFVNWKLAANDRIKLKRRPIWTKVGSPLTKNRPPKKESNKPGISCGDWKKWTDESTA